MIPGLGYMAGGSVKSPTAYYRAATSSASNLTTYTFTSQALNPLQSGTRVVCIGIGNHANGTIRTVSSITLGGSAMTVYRNNGETNGTVSGGAAIAAIETSLATATIVVTFTGSANACALRIFDVWDYNSATPASSALIGLKTSPGSIACAGGSPTAGIGFAALRSGIAAYPTFTGLTGTYADARLENMNVRSLCGGDATSAYISSSTPTNGCAIAITWA